MSDRAWQAATRSFTPFLIPLLFPHPIMSSRLSSIKKKWLALGELCLRVNFFILMTLIFFLVVPLLSFIRFVDPLRERKTEGSFWSPRKPIDPSLRKHTLQF